MYDFNPYGDDKDKRDSKRSFTKSQQKVIFDRQDGYCARCGKKLKLSSTHYHHKKAWSKNGETNVKNGIAVCANCHAEIHIKETVDDLEKKPKKSKKNTYDPFDLGLPTVKAPKTKSSNPFDIDLGLPKAKKSKNKTYDPFSLDLGLPKGKKPKGGFGLF
jgi:DNA-directed RNA polymerase subunit RPC12/RpoP